MIKNASSVALFKHFHFGENTLHENNTFHLCNIDSLLERSVQAGIFMIYVENIAIMIVGYTTFSSHQISFRLRYTLCSDKTQTCPTFRCWAKERWRPAPQQKWGTVFPLSIPQSQSTINGPKMMRTGQGVTLYFMNELSDFNSFYLLSCC